MTDTNGEVGHWLSRLDAIAAAIADAAGPLLGSASVPHYRALLSACYHYTRDSGRQLERAAALAPTDELRDFFAEMADDERDHYRLAEADLAALGGSVDAAVPAAVADFAAYWNAVARDDFFELLGATHVLENLADRLREPALAALARLGVGRRQSRFVLTHLEADAEHGRRVAGVCACHLPEHGPAMLRGAEAAARFAARAVGELARLSREPAKMPRFQGSSA